MRAPSVCVPADTVTARETAFCDAPVLVRSTRTTESCGTSTRTSIRRPAPVRLGHRTIRPAVMYVGGWGPDLTLSRLPPETRQGPEVTVVPSAVTVPVPATSTAESPVAIPTRIVAGSSYATGLSPP